MVKVRFNKNYIAARGPGISGAKGAEKSFDMSEQLQALIDDGTVELVKETAAASRKKATGKKGAEEG